MGRGRALRLLPILGAGAVVASIATSPARTYVKPACWADIPGMLPQKHVGTPYDLTDFVLASKFVSGPVKYTIASPRIVFARANRAVMRNAVICLPGRGGLGRDVFDGFRLHEVAPDVVPPTQHTVFVGVDSGESYWHARESGEDRMRMLLTELIPHLERIFDVRVRAAMGWSMGGYGALLAASRAPERFTTVAVASAALFPSYEIMRKQVPDAFDSSIDFAPNDLFRHPAGLVGKPLWLACGEGDPFVDAARAFAPPRARVTRVLTAGCHEEGFWRRQLAVQTAYIANALST